MISYKPFWETLQKRGLTQYRLKKEFNNFNNDVLDKLRHDKPLNLTTIDDICIALDCDIEDIVKIEKPVKSDDLEQK